MRQGKKKKNPSNEIAINTGMDNSSIVCNGTSLLTGTGTGMGITTTTTTTNITLNPSSNLYINNGGGSSLFFSVNEVCDLKSLIVEKKISLKSFVRENSFDIFDVKKIKLKRKAVEIECAKKIDTNEIDSLNSKQSLISEIIDVNMKSDIRKSAINHNENSFSFSLSNSLSFTTYLGGGNAAYPGTITIGGNYNNIAIGTSNEIAYSY